MLGELDETIVFLVDAFIVDGVVGGGLGGGGGCGVGCGGGYGDESGALMVLKQGQTFEATKLQRKPFNFHHTNSD